MWYAGSPLKAAAVLVSPQQKELFARETEIARYRYLPRIMGQAATARFSRVLEGLHRLHQEQSLLPHWHLSLLGVDPVWQNHGVGTALMNRMLSHVDKARQPVYVETQKVGNLTFHAKFGFEPLVEGAIEPVGGLIAWTLLRHKIDSKLRI